MLTPPLSHQSRSPGKDRMHALNESANRSPAGTALVKRKRATLALADGKRKVFRASDLSMQENPPARSGGVPLCRARRWQKLRALFSAFLGGSTSTWPSHMSLFRTERLRVKRN